MHTRLTVIYDKRGEHFSMHRLYSAESWDECVISAARDLRNFARFGPREIIAAELSDGATVNKVFQPSEWGIKLPNVRYQLFVKWRFITSPDVKETECGGRPWKGKTPEEVGEDNYHPDKLVFVGPPCDTAEQARTYARERGWSVEDTDITSYEIR